VQLYKYIKKKYSCIGDERMISCDEIVALKNSEDFIKIMDGKIPYYGGDQKWFNDNVYRRVGCSSVAAANITAYTAINKGKESLYCYEDMCKVNFTKHMKDVGKFLCPDERIGMISTLNFMERVVDFAESRFVKIKPNWITTEFDFERIKDFIKEALKDNLPIALLMLKNRKLEEFSWHWMTVTKLFENEDKNYLHLSTWGEKRVIALEDFYKYSYYGTLTYFSVN
jgi:hypothetical protein